jgi:hypothetical protein
MSRIRLRGREIPLPRSRIARVVIGVLMVGLGLLGFLPVLGFWMVPLGLMILSIDLPAVRRFRRRMEVWISRKWRAWRAERARVKRIQGS